MVISEGKGSLSIPLNLLNIRSKIWRQSLTKIRNNICTFCLFHSFLLQKGKAKKKNVEESWDWSNERTKGLSAINQMIQLDIQRLWDPPIVEDEFTK